MTQVYDTRDPESSMAFNQGSDARIAGRKFETNPYGNYSYTARMWYFGWRSVDLDWGKDAKWPVLKLPEVQ